ncbi:hypothetical protein EXS71_01050 [Candidatus Uhrbacteria bacterium]|nr:hypothetical protein [Candidatus Uhrbacteria bacterium]
MGNPDNDLFREMVRVMPSAQIPISVEALISQAHPVITEAAILQIFHFAPHRQALVPHIHTLPMDWQLKILDHYFRADLGHGTNTRPGWSWLDLKTADPAIRQNYLQGMKRSLNLHADDQILQAVLDDPRLPQLLEKFSTSHEGERLLIQALRKPAQAQGYMATPLQILQEHPGIDPTVLAAALLYGSTGSEEVVQALRRSEWQNIEAIWGPELLISIQQRFLPLLNQQERFFAFFVRPELTEGNTRLGSHAQVLMKNFLSNHRGLYNGENDERFLMLISSPSLAKVVERFPEYADEFIGNLRLHEKTLEFLSVLEKAQNDEEFFVEFIGYYPAAFPLCMGKIPKEQLSRVIDLMAEKNLPWEQIALVPADWEAKKQALLKRSERIAGEFVGGVVVQTSLRHSLKDQELFEGQTKHLEQLAARLRNFSYGRDTNMEDIGKTLEVILGAHEALSNSDLRDKLEGAYLSTGFPLKASELTKLPPRIHASLYLLIGKYGLSREISSTKYYDGITDPYPNALQRLSETLYAGKTLKKQEDLDAFNYFLLAGIGHHDAMRGFLFESIPLMERSEQATAAIFDISQLLRGFWAMEPGDERLKVVIAELKDLGENVWPTPKMKQAQRVEFERQEAATIVSRLETLKQRLSDQIVEVFNQKCGVELSAQETKKFLATFKDPSQIFLYFGKLNEYPREPNQQKILFQKFIEGVARGTFPDLRYTLGRQHLDKIFERRKKDEVVWRENSEIRGLEDLPQEDAADVGQRIQNVVDGSMLDRHVPDAWRPALTEFLASNPQERAKVIQRTEYEIGQLGLATKLFAQDISEKTRRAKEAISKNLTATQLEEVKLMDLAFNVSGMPEMAESLKTLQSVQKLFRLMQASTEEFSSGRVRIEGGTNKEIDFAFLFRELKKAAEDYPDFVRDVGVLEGIANTAANRGKQAVLIAGLRVEESEDPDLGLRMGTDVEGSCQNLAGSANLNRNLISYIMDGKIKTLFVRDGQGLMIARSIMRVLYDEKKKTPVIHLEQSYHRSGSQVIEYSNRLFLALAKTKARALGYPLVLSSRFRVAEKTTPYPNDILSYGGPGAVEYVDNLGNDPVGGQPDQRYTIAANRISQVEV